MTPDDLDTIEGQLGVRLPADYREVMLNYPPELREGAAGWELKDDPSLVIDETLFQRLNWLGGEMRLPGDLIVIGASGCGNHYYLDLGKEPATVVIFDRGRARFEEVAWSVQGWCKTLLKQRRASHS